VLRRSSRQIDSRRQLQLTELFANNLKWNAMDTASMAEAHIAEDLVLRWGRVPMQPWAEDMQLRVIAAGLRLLRIASLVDPTHVCVVHDHNGRIPSNGRQELFLALAVGVTQLHDVKDLVVGPFEPLSHALEMVISTDDRCAGELLLSVGGLARARATNQEDHSRGHEVLSDQVGGKDTAGTVFA